MLVDLKNRFATLSQATLKISDFVSQAIIASLTPLARCVKTVTYVNEKKFEDHAVVDEALKSTAYFADLFAS